MYIRLIKLLIPVSLSFTSIVSQAANECQIIVTKTNNLPYPIIIMSKRQTKTFNMTFKRIQSPANNIMANVKTGALTIPVFIASGQSYFSMEGSRLVKIQCLSTKTSKSGNLFPTPQQIINNFRNTPTKIVSVLKTLLHKTETEIALLMVRANISPSVIALSIKNVFSGSANVAKRVVVGLTQAGQDAKSVARATLRAFGNTIQGKLIAKWLRNAGYTTAQKRIEIGQMLKDVFRATRTQGEQWLSYAGYSANQVRDIVQRVWGAARTATRTVTRTVSRGATAIWGGVKIYANSGKIIARDIANQMKKAGKSVNDVIAALKKFGVKSNYELVVLLKVSGYTAEQIVNGLKQIKLDAYTVIQAMVSAFRTTATGKNLTIWLRKSHFRVEKIAAALERHFKISKGKILKMLIEARYDLNLLARALRLGLRMRLKNAASELYKAGFRNSRKLINALVTAGYASADVAKEVASLLADVRYVPQILTNDALFASYKMYYSLVGAGVSKNKLHNKYIDALLALKVRVNRFRIKVGISSYLSKNPLQIAMTDCNTIYFPSSQNVRAIINGQNISYSQAHWLLHEIRHTIQCNRGTRKQYALTWWKQLPAGVVKSIKSADAKYLHNAMPMEKDAAAFADKYINQFKKELIKVGIQLN